MSVQIRSLHQNQSSSLEEVTTYWPTGELKEQFTIKNGEKHGMYTLYYKDGALKRQCNYANGFLDGKDIKMYPTEEAENTGKLLSQNNYEQGLLHNSQYYYWPNGNLSKIQTFAYNKLVNEKCFDEQGGKIYDDHSIGCIIA